MHRISLVDSLDQAGRLGHVGSRKTNHPNLNAFICETHPLTPFVEHDQVDRGLEVFDKPYDSLGNRGESTKMMKSEWIVDSQSPRQEYEERVGEKESLQAGWSGSRRIFPSFHLSIFPSFDSSPVREYLVAVNRHADKAELLHDDEKTTIGGAVIILIYSDLQEQ